MRRFTLRDLFWLTLVVAIGVGWAVDGGQVRSRVEELERDYQAERAVVSVLQRKLSMALRERDALLRRSPD